MKSALFATFAIFVATLLVAAPPAFAALSLATASPVMSTWEQSTGGTLSRDCGYSAPISSTTDLWVFCDTAIYNSSRSLIGFVAGSTAAINKLSTGQLPQPVTELPAGSPHQFVANPSTLVTPTGSPCTRADGAYPAAWPSGATHIPATSKVLITYSESCVALNSTYIYFEGYGVATYAPGYTLPLAGHTVFSWTPGTASLSLARNLGSPIYSGSYIYFYSSDCTANDGYGDCSSGNVYLSRVPTGKYATGSAYKWLTPSGAWTSYPSQAGDIISGATPIGVNAVVTSHGVTLVSQNNIAGSYTVWTSNSFGYGFKAASTGTVPCTLTANGVSGFCRAIIPHAELSNQTQLTLTWFDPSAATTGHVVADQLLW